MYIRSMPNYLDMNITISRNISCTFGYLKVRIEEPSFVGSAIKSSKYYVIVYPSIELPKTKNDTYIGNIFTEPSNISYAVYEFIGVNKYFK